MASGGSSVIKKNKTAHKRENHHQLINQKMNKNTFYLLFSPSALFKLCTKYKKKKWQQNY